MPNDNNTNFIDEFSKKSEEQKRITAYNVSEISRLNEKIVGGNTVIELAKGIPEKQPEEEEWRRFMAGTAKGFDLSPNSITSQADDQNAFTETIVSQFDISFKFDGEVRKEDIKDEFGFHNMLNYIINQMKARQQPSLWARFNFGCSTLTGYMVVTAFSGNAETNALFTSSVEFKVADGTTVEVSTESPKD